MYYDNKFRFYIQQYGTQIIVGIICLVIIVSGLFVYFKINGKTQNISPITNASNAESNNEGNITPEDDTILSEELKKLQIGQKATVKVATVDDQGVLVLLSGDKRIKAKMIGTDISREMPDTIYSIDQDLAGKYVNIAFDESKIANGYAMVYIYTDESNLYNAKLLKEGKLIFDSSISKKAVEYNSLAESQAYAKQTLAGVWGD